MHIFYINVLQHGEQSERNLGELKISVGYDSQLCISKYSN